MEKLLEILKRDKPTNKEKENKKNKVEKSA